MRDCIRRPWPDIRPPGPASRRTRPGAPAIQREETMIIYGVAALAACHLAGVILGDLLGVILGVQSNVGGVGFAMLTASV